MAEIATVQLIERLAEEYESAGEKENYKNRKKKCCKCKWRGSAGKEGMTGLYCNWSYLNNRNFRDCTPINCKYFERGKKVNEKSRTILARRVI